MIFDKMFPISYFYRNRKRFLFFTDKPTKTDIEFSSNPAIIGNEVTITCSSNGQSKPSFTIIHNGTINISGIEETYTISKVNWDDAGYYTCVAIYKLGSHPSDSRILNVTVKGKVSSKDVSSFSKLLLPIIVSSVLKHHISPVNCGNACKYNCIATTKLDISQLQHYGQYFLQESRPAKKDLNF